MLKRSGNPPALRYFQCGLFYIKAANLMGRYGTGQQPRPDRMLVGAVRANPRVFTLASDAKSIRELAEQLVYYGLGKVKVSVGARI